MVNFYAMFFTTILTRGRKFVCVGGGGQAQEGADTGGLVCRIGLVLLTAK